MKGHWRLAMERSRAPIVIVVLLLAAIIISISVEGIEFAGEDRVPTVSGTPTATTLQAAERGMQFASSRLELPEADLSAFTLNTGDGTLVRSGRRDDPGPQAIRSSIARPPDGFAINVGSGYHAETYQVTVSAFGPESSVAEIEGKFRSVRPGGRAYR